MSDNSPTYRSAQLLIERHGLEANAFAHQRMLAMMEKDDLKGASFWLAIGQAVEDLQTAAGKGELH